MAWSPKPSPSLSLRAVAVALRGLLARWEEVVRVSGTSAPLHVVGAALDDLARVEGVSLTHRPAVDPDEARALLDAADHGKTLMGQLGALYRVPRWDQDRWVARLAGTVESLAGALSRLPSP